MSESISELTSNGFGNLILYGLGEPTGFHEPLIVLAIPFTPQTVGWLVVLLVVCLYVCLRVRSSILHWAKNRYRKQYLSQLPNIESHSFAYDSFRIMTKIRTISNNGNPDYKAHLFGREWLKSMDEQCSKRSNFDSNIGREWMKLLTGQRKDTMTSHEKKHLLECCEFWILNHSNSVEKKGELEKGGSYGA